MTDRRQRIITRYLYDGGFQPQPSKRQPSVDNRLLPAMVFYFPGCCVEAPSSRVGGPAFSAIYLWMAQRIGSPVLFHVKDRGRRQTG